MRSARYGMLLLRLPVYYFSCYMLPLYAISPLLLPLRHAAYADDFRRWRCFDCLRAISLLPLFRCQRCYA